MRVENRTDWHAALNFVNSKSGSYSERIAFDGITSPDWVFAKGEALATSSVSAPD